MGKVIKFASLRPPSSPTWTAPVPVHCIVCHDIGEPCGCMLRASLERVQASWWRRVLWWAVTR
jgi:hypothetical protein